MRNPLRRPFWLETSMATVTSILLVITSIWRDWIEIVFGVDPDRGNGTLEWLIVAALLVVAIMLITLASYEWRRSWITTA